MFSPQMINNSKKVVVSIDVPSGTNIDKGNKNQTKYYNILRGYIYAF